MVSIRKSQPHSKTSNAVGLGQVRIIGGELRGRKLSVRTAEGLRPTPDRVRETLFNWLQFDVAGAVCCDVFAGSGVLGVEAISRGAAVVLFLELNKANARQLEQNVQSLKLRNTQIQVADSLAWLAKSSTQQFDIIFLDPPFYQNLMQPTIDLIFAQNWLKNNQAWLYLEQENTLDWPNLPEGWVCHREKRTSQVKYGLFCYRP